jgi:hypothetical protein
VINADTVMEINSLICFKNRVHLPDDNMLVLPGCDLGQVIIFFGFNGVQPWARHFY